MRAFWAAVRLIKWLLRVRDFFSPKARKQKREDKARDEQDEIYGEE